MSCDIRKRDLNNLIIRYTEAKLGGNLNLASEETMRSWINELLNIFGWDVQDTHQVLQERQLNESSVYRLRAIGSSNIRPDYTLVNGGVKLCFIDAKSLTVNIETDSNASFQIRSYGWSIGSDFSIITNFDEIAIYDCTVLPVADQPADFARIHYFKNIDFVEKFELIDSFLFRDNIINKNYSIDSNNGESPDFVFANLLSLIRVKIANSILCSNSMIRQRCDVSLISLWVQIIINRILFIRVCESRGLETDGLLMQFAETDFWGKFKNSSYLDFYNHYDGPIFARIEQIQNLNIDNQVFIELLSFLYYPSPYKFDVLPLKSISDIYDLFLSKQLILNDGVISDTLKNEYRRSRGAVVTPIEVVQQTINRTLTDDYLNSLTIDEILNLRILDPACGSGVFLAEIYDVLASKIISKLQLSQSNRNDIATASDGQYLLTIDGKKRIINNCLFGVDIDLEAVEVARMSLSLKIIDAYNPSSFEIAGLLGHQILSGIGENIRNGNTLVESNILEMYPSLIDNIDELTKTRIFNWESAFPTVFKSGGFDYVIGNPPYVEVKNYNVDLPTMALYIKNHFESSRNGKIDLAIPFVEKGLCLLNERGRLGYIIQKRFFKTDYGKGIRKYITENNVLNSIYDYQQNNLFKDRITYVAIIVCDKNAENNAVIKYINSEDDVVKSIPSSYFGRTPWDFSNLEFQSIKMRLSQLGTVESTLKIKVGIQVLWDRAYHIEVSSIDDNCVYGKSKLSNSVCIEKEACRSIICNNNFKALYSIDLNKTVAIFPYDIIDGNASPISYSDFGERYPLAKKYLDTHRNIIEKNVQTLPEIDTRLDRDENWHLYTRVQNHSAIYEKVCIPMTSKYPIASVVETQNVYCDNANMYFVEIPNNSEVKRYALATIVNSNIFRVIAKSIANPQQGGYYKFNKQFLDPIPFPQNAFETETQDIVELSRIGKQIELYNIRRSSLSHLEEASIQIVIDRLWRNANDICDRIYGITQEDRRFFYIDRRRNNNE